MTTDDDRDQAPKEERRIAHMSRRALQTLEPGEWLDDTIVNAVADAVNLLCPNIYCFDPCLYTLLRCGSGSGRTNPFVGPVTRLRKRLEDARGRLGVMGRTRFVVPACEGSHWILIVYEPLAERCVVYDPMNRIVPRSAVAQVGFALAQCMGAKRPEIDIAFFDEHQQNGSDCGMYVCCAMVTLGFGGDPTKVSRAKMGEHRRFLRQLMEENSDVVE